MSDRAGGGRGPAQLVLRRGGEEVGGQRDGRAVQQGLSLGLELIELRGPSRIWQIRVVAPPQEGTFKIGARLRDLAEVASGHGQEEEVECVGEPV
jgi:hypothetical protein